MKDTAEVEQEGVWTPARAYIERRKGGSVLELSFRDQSAECDDEGTREAAKGADLEEEGDLERLRDLVRARIESY